MHKGKKREADANAALAGQQSTKRAKPATPAHSSSKGKSAGKKTLTTLEAPQTDNDSSLQRSSRSNKGEGGALLQLTNVAQAIEERVVAPKTKVQGIPSSQVDNPMAPTIVKPKHRCKIAKELQANPLSSSSLPLTHLVPPGTEPYLPGPQLGWAARSHQFGFQPSIAQMYPVLSPPPANIHAAHHDNRVSGPSAMRPSQAQPQHQTALVPSRQVHLPPIPDSSVHPLGPHVPSATESEPVVNNGLDGNEDGDNDNNEDTDDGNDTDNDDGDNLQTLIEQFGPDGYCYEDSRVVDMLSAGILDTERLRNLLLSVEETWTKDQRQLAQGSMEVVPSSGSNGANWMQLTVANDESYDVLQNHHKKNGAPKPPQPPLRESQPVDNDEDMSDSDNGTDSDLDEDKSGGPSTQRAKRYSGTPYGGGSADPTQLQFYPTNWIDTLTSAKKEWRMFLVSTWAFPKMRIHKDQLKECLMRAIAAHEADGGVLEEGYYPKYENKMLKLIWEDTSSFRGELKKAARQVVRSKYDILPTEAQRSHFRSPMQHINHIAAAVSKVLVDGDFLHDGQDAEGRTNNLTHEAIADLCMSFYYGPNGLAHMFPAKFKSQVPEMGVVLVATAIKCALDEWKEGQHKNIPFTAQEYRAVYQALVALLEQIQTNKYHNDKLLSALRSWANGGRPGPIGSAQTDVETLASGPSFGFKVHLD